jgi:hypothetical protein
VIGFVLNFSLSEPLFNLEQTKQLAQIGEYWRVYLNKRVGY